VPNRAAKENISKAVTKLNDEEKSFLFLIRKMVMMRKIRPRKAKMMANMISGFNVKIPPSFHHYWNTADAVR